MSVAELIVTTSELVVCWPWKVIGSLYRDIHLRTSHSCVMELDKMDENDWKYHGEGNKSLVVSHVQVS